jgi:DNA mismatch repair protein MutL
VAARIRILPDIMADRIAAGEVVERPASVVKELMENSLDAGASSVSVEVGGSGRQLIKVEDDGAGMCPDDLLLSLERHATSKIRSVQDLYAVRTLGFRGEALPSIASVSRMTIASCEGNGTPGSMVRIEGGRIKKVEEVARPKGTAVEVRSLFYNTPARLKFMKSQATERGWINTLFQRQALAHPQVHFRLRMGGREGVNAPSTPSLRDRIASLFEAELAQSLLKVEHRKGDLRVWGFISDPFLNRSSRDMQFIFVNGRCVRERATQQAVERAYRAVLPRGRHPVVFLYLEMDPTRVDVNVHPAKLEVKFQDHREVHQIMAEAIAGGLSSRQEPYGISPPAADRKAAGSSRQRISAGPAAISGATAFRREEGSPPAVPHGAGEGCAPARRDAGDGVTYPADREARRATSAEAPSPEPQFRLPVGAGLSPLGQVHNAFIVAGSSEGLVIIDQHTAHERILFERIMGQLREARVDSQHLLIPQAVGLSPLEADLVEERMEELDRLGFAVEAFGKGTVLLRSVPAILRDEDSVQAFQEIAAHLSEVGGLKPFEELAQELATLMACRGAVKAGEPLDDVRMAALLRDLEALEKPASCPHGRPIYLLLGIEEIKKKFLRR